MKSITLTIEITNKEFEVLKKIKEERIAEFRDEESSWDEYLEAHKDIIEKNPEIWTEERFLKRNFGGFKKEVLSLHDKDLVQLSEDAWHLTFELSDLGCKFF